MKRWAVGVTTVPSRRGDLLPRTLCSLKSAGFDQLRLFVDGDINGASWENEFGFPVTTRWPAIRTAGNWFLSLAEMWFRHQEADLYFVAQDDIVALPNLRAYLDRCPYPENGYWSLYTACAANEALVKSSQLGWIKADQKGRGALALVFDKRAVMTLLSPYPGKPHSHMAERTMDTNRGWRCIDGGISEQLVQNGLVEWIHNPSLVQHTGLVSSMQNDGKGALAKSFPGEDTDAMTFLKENALGR